MVRASRVGVRDGLMLVSVFQTLVVGGGALMHHRVCLSKL